MTDKWINCIWIQYFEKMELIHIACTENFYIQIFQGSNKDNEKLKKI